VAAVVMAGALGAAAWKLAQPGRDFRTLAVVTQTDSEWLEVLASRTRRQLSLLHELRVLDEGASPAAPGDAESGAEITLFMSTGRGPSGDRVQVRGVRDGGDGAIWHREYDVPPVLVQHLALPARIAEDVARTLGLEVTADELARMQQIPTANPEAWRLYQVALRLFGSSDRGADNLQAARMFEAAAAADTAFAEAFAKAGEALAVAYRTIRDSALLAQANRNAERALALSPGLPEAYLAAGMIHYVQGRFPQAQTLFATAQRTRPGYQQVEWLQAGILRRQGRWEAALKSYEDMVASYPGHRVSTLGLGRTLLRLRRYRDAITSFDGAIALGPSARDAPYLDKAWALVLGGEPRPSVDRVLAEAEMVTGRFETMERLTEQHATRGWFWFLGDEWGIKLERHRANVEASNRGSWYVARASALRARNDTTGSRAHADSATVALDAQLRDRPRDPALLGVLGLAYALAGKPADGVLWARSGVSLRPVAGDAYDGPDSQFMLAQVLALTGNDAGARVYLDSITRVPSQYSRRLFERVPLWGHIPPLQAAR
jgi:tetratricopeptide (TPR) repeat protein